MTFTVAGGRLQRDGTPFVAVGVNYHPSGAGCRIWTDWDPDAVKRDFHAIAEAGLNTVRLFVFWRDFEPEPGRYDEVRTARLRTVTDLAADAGLVCVLSLFTIWMNGQQLDLPWRAGRSLWLDETMRTRQAAFARRVAAVLRGADNLLAIDLGDEIGNVATTDRPPTRAEVVAWQSELADLLRADLPGVLVTQANDASGVLRGAPFGVDNAAGLDLVATHGFATWSPGSIESTRSYKATNLVPFLASMARAYGTAFVDELGAYGVDEATAAGYLRAATVSALANGAAGVAVWCWQDIASDAEPYRERPAERSAGLLRLDRSARPALAYLRDTAAAAHRLTSRRDRPPIALYVPERQRAAPASYLDSEVGTVGTFYAYLLLKRAHLDFDVVSGPPTGYRLVLCPSVGQITMADLDGLRAALDDGATVYYSMADHLHGFPGTGLSGVELVDFSLTDTGKTAVGWDDDRWPLDWSVAGVPARTVRAVHGRTVARFPDGTPALQVNDVGAGRMVFCTAPYERQLNQPGRLGDENWHVLYRRIAALAGVVPAVWCADPDIELLDGRDLDAGATLAINHGDAPADVTLHWADGGTADLSLDAKDWCLVRPRRERRAS
jgi:hypothetical protein